MKILFFSPHPYLNLNSATGYGTHMREMINAFKNLGHDVEMLIIGEEPSEKSNKAVKQGTFKRVIRLFVPGIIWESIKDYKFQKLDRKNAGELIKKIKSFKPDIVYERSAYLLPCGSIICKQLKLIHILECNAPNIEERVILQGKSFLLKRAKRLEEIQMRSSTLLTFVSSDLKKYYEELYQLENNKTILTPNAINPNNFKIDNTLSDQLSMKYNLKDKTIVGFVGSIFPYHGVDKLIRTFSETLKHHSELVLLIVGDGEPLNELVTLAKKINVEKNVIFTGKVPHENIYTYINMFDIAVMARSNWYGSPVKIFEYGLAKKAIIAPKNGPVQDVMIDGEDGILIENSENELYKAIKTYITNPTLMKGHARSFHTKVISKHTWVKNATKVLRKI